MLCIYFAEKLKWQGICHLITCKGGRMQQVLFRYKLHCAS